MTKLSLLQRKSMLITEGYVIVGGDSFIQEQSPALITIFNLTLTEVTARGMAYVNLVFEALLKRNPTFGGSILLSNGMLTKMIESCARSYTNEKNCESHQVIEIYLTIFSRIFLALPTEIAAFLSILEHFNLTLGQLVSAVLIFCLHKNPFLTNDYTDCPKGQLLFHAV